MCQEQRAEKCWKLGTVLEGIVYVIRKAWGFRRRLWGTSDMDRGYFTYVTMYVCACRAFLRPSFRPSFVAIVFLSLSLFWHEQCSIILLCIWRKTDIRLGVSPRPFNSFPLACFPRRTKPIAQDERIERFLAASVAPTRWLLANVLTSPDGSFSDIVYSHRVRRRTCATKEKDKTA